MWCILTAFFSFFSLFLYDLFQVRGSRVYTRLFSIIGYGGLFLSHFFLGVLCIPAAEADAASIPAMVFGAVFLVLLFYSLFVEIPLKGTFENRDERKVYTSGTYGLNRHPGFLWFALFQICLMILFRRTEVYLFSSISVFFNFILILAEDLWLFPRIFTDYGEYRKKVPFLVPDFFGSRNE